MLAYAPADARLVTTSTPALRLSGVTRRFGDACAIDGLDLEIRQGSVVALLGPNGAGKSTTTEMLLGLQRPDEGTVEVLGTTPTEAIRAGRVGAMLQSGALLDDVSVRVLLRLVHRLHVRPRPIAEVVRIAGLEDVLRTRVARLSGGQAQRVRFALALLPDPSLLLLDEPTVGLDVEARRAFWATMRGLADDGRTIVFTTHYLDEADAVADRVVVLADGRIVADGTGDEVRRSSGGRVVSFRSAVVEPWRTLPGVSDVVVRDGRVTLRAVDSDAVLRAVLAGDATDVEVASARLEDVFVELTSHAA